MHGGTFMNPTYNIDAQSAYTGMVMQLMTLQIEQIHEATSFYLKIKGHPLLDSMLHKYLMNTQDLQTKLIEESGRMNMVELSTDEIYIKTHLFRTMYYNGLQHLGQLANPYANSENELEKSFFELYYNLYIHSYYPFNLYTIANDITKSIKESVSSVTFDEVYRITKELQQPTTGGFND